MSCVPNAGLPDENGHYLESPEMLARSLRRFCEQGWLNVVGGCCGTHTGHVRAIAEAVKGLTPRRQRPRPRSTLSGVDYLEVTRGRAPRHRRRAHQRHRQQEVQGAHRRGPVRGRLGDRPRPGEARRAGHRHLPGQPGPGRARGHAPLPGGGRQEGARAPDDRLHGRARHRDGAHLLPGQGHHQLGQPGGRRGALREGGAAGAPVRRGAGGGLHRREGHGRHPPAQARGRRALLRAAHRRSTA